MILDVNVPALSVKPRLTQTSNTRAKVVETPMSCTRTALGVFIWYNLLTFSLPGGNHGNAKKLSR